MRIAVLTILSLILIPVAISCADFQPDPVYQHIQRYGSGVDVVYCAEHKPKNKQLKKKNFDPKGW